MSELSSRVEGSLSGREMSTRKGSIARAVVELLCRNFGLPNEASSPEVQRYDGQLSLSFVEIARERLRAANLPTAGSGNEIINRALTSSDFSSITSDTLNRLVINAYQYAPATFSIWCAKGFVNDFSLMEIDRVSPPSELFLINEDEEYKYLPIKDGAELVQIRTRGGMVGITRQAFVNDNTATLKNTGRILGLAGKLSQNRTVYSNLLANPKLSDSFAVFSAERGNLLSGSGTALGRDSLASAVKTMRMMTDDQGNPLSVEPKFLLVPPSLEMTAHELCFSDSVPGQNNSAVPNLFKKIGLVPIVEPLLESPVMTGYSSTAWYLLPDPELWPVFQTLALGAVDNLAPYIESRAVFNRDEIQYKVRTDFNCCSVGCKAVKSEGV